MYNRTVRSDTDDLISMRQACSEARSDSERQALKADYESRHGITDTNDRRHASWYAAEQRNGWKPQAPVTRRPPTEDEEHERMLQIGIDLLARDEEIFGGVL